MTLHERYPNYICDGWPTHPTPLQVFNSFSEFYSSDYYRKTCVGMLSVFDIKINQWGEENYMLTIYTELGPKNIARIEGYTGTLEEINKENEQYLNTRNANNLESIQ